MKKKNVINEIIKLKNDGKTQTEIAKILNISQGTVSINLKYWKYDLELSLIEKENCIKKLIGIIHQYDSMICNSGNIKGCNTGIGCKECRLKRLNIDESDYNTIFNPVNECEFKFDDFNCICASCENKCSHCTTCNDGTGYTPECIKTNPCVGCICRTCIMNDTCDQCFECKDFGNKNMACILTDNE